MLKHLLKKEYPSLRKADYEKAVAFIDGKCSPYYFLDFMRTTGGNVDDVIIAKYSERHSLSASTAAKLV